jgi:hypothetical protein
MYMTVPRQWSGRALCDLGQFIEDPAVLRFLTTQAGFTQAFELLFQLAQFPDSFGHMAYVLIQKLIDLKAILSWCVLESQQDTNLIQRHVQATAMTDKGQPFCMGVTVNTVIALTATGLCQQVLALVETDRFDLRVRESGQFADFHGNFLKGLTL